MFLCVLLIISLFLGMILLFCSLSKHILVSVFLGLLKYFLGIKVSRSLDGFFLSKPEYAIDIISRTSLLGAKPADTPLYQNHNMARVDGPLYYDPSQY